MFLYFLSDEAEQKFFLKFAYLLAVAESRPPGAESPVRAYADHPERGEYEFEEFAPDFSMPTKSLLLLRKFATEMGIGWAPVFSHGTGPTLSHAVGGFLSSVWDGPAAQGGGDALQKIIREHSVADMLKVAGREMGPNAHRLTMLKIVLSALFAQSGASSFAPEKKRAILLEATAICGVGRETSENEQELLGYFCEFCHMDRGMVGEFAKSNREFSAVYDQIIRLITGRGANEAKPGGARQNADHRPLRPIN